MEENPRYVGIDVSKAQVDVAVRPTGQRWAASYDETGRTNWFPRLLSGGGVICSFLASEATGGLATAVGGDSRCCGAAGRGGQARARWTS